MQRRGPAKPDAELLPKQAAERLLARASELDAARHDSAALTDLRAAAAEAGISAESFDEALAELRAADEAQVPEVSTVTRPRLGVRTLALGATAAILLLIGVFMTTRLVSVPTSVAQTFPVRCLTPGQVAELMRPVLGNTGTFAYNPQVPGTVTIRGTPEQIASARSLLERNDGAGGSCPAASPRTPTP
jgi:hypothetical protein